jgi:hypothetical protein
MIQLDPETKVELLYFLCFYYCTCTVASFCLVVPCSLSRGDVDLLYQTGKEHVSTSVGESKVASTSGSFKLNTKIRCSWKGFIAFCQVTEALYSKALSHGML